MKHNAKKGFGMFEGIQWGASKHTKTFVSTVTCFIDLFHLS